MHAIEITHSVDHPYRATSSAFLRSPSFCKLSLLRSSNCCVCSEFQSLRNVSRSVVDCIAAFLISANICALLALGLSKGATNDGMLDRKPSSYAGVSRYVSKCPWYRVPVLAASQGGLELLRIVRRPKVAAVRRRRSPWSAQPCRPITAIKPDSRHIRMWTI